MLLNLKHLNYHRFLKTWIILCLDLILSFFASVLSLLLIGAMVPDLEPDNKFVLIWLLGSVASSFIVFRASKTYRAFIRYSTLRELGRICLTCLFKDILLWLIMGVFSVLPITSALLAGIVVIDYCFTVLALSVTRIIMIAVYDRLRANNNQNEGLHRVLVYGTGDKAASAVSRLRNSPHYHIVGFISFGEKSSEHRMAGLEVCYFQNPADIASTADKYDVSGILFPYVAAARAEQDRLIEYCKGSKLKTYIVPGIDELTEGAAISNYIRK